jgi:hypothetical protein
MPAHRGVWWCVVVSGKSHTSHGAILVKFCRVIFQVEKLNLEKKNKELTGENGRYQAWKFARNYHIRNNVMLKVMLISRKLWQIEGCDQRQSYRVLNFIRHVFRGFLEKYVN